MHKVFPSDVSITKNNHYTIIYIELAFIIIDVMNDVYIVCTNPNIFCYIMFLSSWVVNIYVAITLNRNCNSVSASFFGMGLILDIHRCLINPHHKDGSFPVHSMIFTTRVVELIVESFPQLMYQFGRMHDKAAVLSFLVSLMSVSSCMVFIDVYVSSTRSTIDILFFGFVSDKTVKATAQMASMFVFFGSFVFLRLKAISALVAFVCSQNEYGLVIILFLFIFECLSLFMVRLWIENWKWYLVDDSYLFKDKIRHVDIISHILCYFFLSCCPVFTSRIPILLTPMVYNVGVAYMLLSSNYWIFVSDVNQLTIQFMVTCLCVISYILFLLLTTKRQGFIKHVTWKSHVEDYRWEELTEEYDLKNCLLTTLDSSRAHIPLWCRTCYVPHEKCESLIKHNWCNWKKEDWFNEDFKEKIKQYMLSRSFVFVNDGFYDSTMIDH